jgi:hypothetical protein
MVTFTLEHHYILISNRDKCEKLLKKKKRTRTDIIDFLVSLHLVLEVGLNAFYRNIILIQLQKGIEQTVVANNLDNIDFINKTALFFYLPSFDFGGRISDADKYHAAIGKLKQFCEVRNRLLHGHMDGQINYGEERVVHTRTSELISENTIKTQIEIFQFVMESVKFYFDHLKSSITVDGKENIKYFYLSASFLEGDK